MNNVQLLISSEIFVNKIENNKKWIKFLKEDLKCELCELSLDFFPFFIQEPTKSALIEEFIELCDSYQIQIPHTYTGKCIRNFNMLFHPNFGFRMHAIKYFEQAIDITAGLDAIATGGFLGVFPLDHLPNIIKFSKEDNSGSYFIKENSKNLKEVESIESIKSKTEYDLKNMEIFGYYQNVIVDALSYLTNIAYSAGLDEFIMEMPYFSSNMETQIIMTRNIIEKINANSKIPVKLSITAYDNASLNYIAEFIDNISIIRFKKPEFALKIKEKLLKSKNFTSQKINVQFSQKNPLKLIFEYKEDKKKLSSYSYGDYAEFIRKIYQNFEIIKNKLFHTEY
ncbi:MAG: hypothetical protein ACTSRZ_01305 [Promethearchaeota archaeon]